MSFPTYESYKDSGVEWLGEVPEHWKIASLSRLFSIKAGGDVKTEFFSEVKTENHPYPIYTNANDEKAVYGFTSKCNYSPNTITVSGRGEVGFAAYRDHAYDAIIRLLVLSPIGTSDCKFFTYFINAVINFRVQSSAIGQLSTQQISSYKVAFPSFDEQQAIAFFLDRETAKIDGLIAEQQRLIELLKEKRQAVISHAVTKGLNPDAPIKDSGIEWLGEVPEHWEVKQLRHLAKIVRGASPRPAGDPKFFSAENFDGENTPWVTVAEITKDSRPYLTEVNEYLTPTGVKNSQFFEAGTLVFSNSGATLGVPKILSINCCANDGVLAFKDLYSGVEILFAYHFLSTTTERLRTEMKQGGGQPNLNTDIVKNIGIAIPPLSEQSSIVDFLDNKTTKLDTLTAEAQRGIDLLKERRTALISAAVTGKIDVRRCQPHSD